MVGISNIARDEEEGDPTPIDVVLPTALAHDLTVIGLTFVDLCIDYGVSLEEYYNAATILHEEILANAPPNSHDTDS